VQIENRKREMSCDPKGLLSTQIVHEANEFYPDQKFGDFSGDYDAEISGIPWNTLGNCCICGRIQVYFKKKIHIQNKKKRNA
jgi:hypothetical protein